MRDYKHKVEWILADFFFFLIFFFCNILFEKKGGAFVRTGEVKCTCSATVHCNTLNSIDLKNICLYSIATHLRLQYINYFLWQLNTFQLYCTTTLQLLVQRQISGHCKSPQPRCLMQCIWMNLNTSACICFFFFFCLYMLRKKVSKMMHTKSTILPTCLVYQVA